MATQQEVRDAAAVKLRRKVRQEIVWADVTAAFGAASQAERDAVVNAIRAADQVALRNAVTVVMGGYIILQAQTEADTIVADNSIDFVEWERIYA